MACASLKSLPHIHLHLSDRAVADSGEIIKATRAVRDLSLHIIPLRCGFRRFELVVGSSTTLVPSMAL